MGSFVKKVSFIVLLLVLLCLMVLGYTIYTRPPDYAREKEIYGQIQTNGENIGDLLIPIESLPEGWKPGPNFVRTKHDHGEMIQTVYYDPPSGPNGFYQEVIKFENGFEAWSFVRRIPLLPDRYWIEDPKYIVKISNSADQWVLACRDDYLPEQVSCGLVARYKDVIVYVSASSTDTRLVDSFLEIAKIIDNTACEIGYCDY